MTEKKSAHEIERELFSSLTHEVPRPTLNDETKTIHFPVHWYDADVTPDSLKKHIEFINGNLLITRICTAAELELKAGQGADTRDWQGEMDLGGIKLHARHDWWSEKETTKLSLSLTHQFNEEQIVLEESHCELDRERCKNLFK